MSESLLVTGASGQLGRKVVEDLVARGGNKIIAATRDPSKLADLTARGVEVRAADFEKPETLAGAFAGVDRMLLISTDAIVVPGQRLAQHRAAVAAADKAGVKHVVYTSIIAPKPSADSIIEDDHFFTEQAIAASSMSWTFMRHGLYAEALLWALPRALQQGTWADASANKPRSWVTRADCGSADAAALASSDTGKRIYDITGPEALTAEQVAGIVSEVTGKPLAHADVPADVLRQGMAGAGMPPTLIGAMLGFDIATALGYYGVVTPAIEELTGQAPTSLRDFIVANRDALLAPPQQG